MDKPIIIPQPQNLVWRDAPPLPIPQRIVLRADASDIERLAAERLAVAVQSVSGHDRAVIDSDGGANEIPAFRLNLSEAIQEREAYQIYDDGRDVHFVAREPIGLSHAVETTRQLLRREGWPRCSVQDWPDYAWRGVYVECFWGTDLMDLTDWQEFVDYLIGLKFNTLNVGLYGCWEIKFNSAPTEFLMVPLRRYSQLQTPQRIRYLDPGSLEWVERTYLPCSYEQDLLPQVFAYARARGMEVVPQFGGPGHNTLIPRSLPEVSARNSDGTPTYYGYCVSCPQTWEFLQNVVGELVQRYCRPFGVRRFNIAGDEVYPIRNILPEDPTAEVSPWCACATCRELSHYQQLSRYLLGMVELLAQRDINAVIWADSLDRLGAVEAFKEDAARRGLTDGITLQWWCYKEPLPELTSAPELETWVEPSPGLIGNLLYQDFSRNIYGFLQRGKEAGATGVTAYNVPDRSLDKNYACLAEFSWNTGAGSIPHFHIRYAQQTYGEAWRQSLEAYDVAERIMGCYPMAVNVMDQLLHYFNNFPYGRVDYPTDLIRALVSDPLALLAGIRLVEAHMRSAEDILHSITSGGEVRSRFILECRRYRTLAAAVLAIVDGLQAFSQLQAQAGVTVTGADQLFSDVKQELVQIQVPVARAGAELRDTMLEMQNVKAAYLAPSALRECSPLLDLLRQMARELGSIASTYAARPQNGLPDLSLMRKLDLQRLRQAWHPWEF